MAMLGNWWYTIAGDETHIDWTDGGSLPSGANWTSAAFLNQFVERTNNRRYASYSAGMVIGVTEKSLLITAGTDVQNREWLNSFVKDCTDYVSYPTQEIQNTGDTIYSYDVTAGTFTTTNPGDFIPHLMLTELRFHLDKYRVFCKRNMHPDSGVSGTITDRAWAWEYQRPPDESFWKETPHGARGSIGYSFDDFGEWGSAFADGVRLIRDVAAPEVSFLATGREITVASALFVVGDSQNGDVPVGGWPYYPGDNKLRKIGSGSGSIQTKLQLVGASYFSTDLFMDYNPHPDPDTLGDAGNMSCDYAKFIKITAE